WNERCEPPWPVDELETKKRQDLYGVEWDEGADNALSRRGEPLIKNLLDRFAMSVVCGQSNSGKTFMALDLAYHVDRKVKQGLVVYVAAEGGRAVFKRTAALKKTHALANVPLVVVPCPINLLQTEKQSDTQKIIDLVRGYEAEFGLKCELLVVDTNASTDMGNFIRQVDRIRAELQTHVLVVHHAGKDIARGSRGWSGIQAATDTEIEIHENKLTVTKQRDIDPMRSIGFRLRSVAIGQDADGEAVTSCVVNYCGAPEFNVDLAPAEKKAANVVKALASEKATEGDMTITLTFAEIHVHYEAVNGA